MATLPVTGVGDSADPTGWSSAPNGVLQVIASANDANFAENTSNLSGTSTLDQGYLLGDTPSDFATMDSLSVRIRYGWNGAFSNRTWTVLGARIMDGATVLAAADADGAFTEAATAITNTTPETGSVVAFAHVNTTATKAQWDAGVVELRQVSVRTAGGSSVARRVYAFEVTGVYTVASVRAVTTMKAWSGSVWQPGLLQRYDGTAWADALVQRYDGAVWADEYGKA